MAKILKINAKATEAVDKLKGQSKELLKYIIDKYGIDKPIDQSSLVLELNSHQFDTVVLSKQSTSPISRLFEFYRTSVWLKQGLVTVTSENKGPARDAKEPGKWKKLEAQHLRLVEHAKALEALLEQHKIEYPELLAEEEAPEGADATEGSEVDDAEGAI